VKNVSSAALDREKEEKSVSQNSPGIEISSLETNNDTQDSTTAETEAKDIDNAKTWTPDLSPAIEGIQPDPEIKVTVNKSFSMDKSLNSGLSQLIDKALPAGFELPLAGRPDRPKIPILDSEEYCQLRFKEGKAFNVSEQTILEFQIISGLNPIFQIELIIRISDEFAAHQILYDLPAGSQLDFEGVRFVPERPGEEYLSITLTGFFANGLIFRSTGQFLFQVKKQKKTSIIAKRDIIGFDPSMLEMPDRYPDSPRWTVVPMQVDKDTLSRSTQIFPQPAIEGCAFESLARRGKAGKITGDYFGILNEKSGRRINVFTCSPLAVGRSSKESDWSVRFLAEMKDQQYLLRRISRHHCDIWIRERKATIIDRSSCGLTINGIRVPKDFEVILADQDIVSLADVFDFRVQIQTDERRIGSVVLQRHNDAAKQSTYILLQHWVGLAGIGAEVKGWLLNEEGSIYYVPGPGTSAALQGRPVQAAAAHCWGYGDRLEQTETSLSMERPQTCSNCEQKETPRPDSWSCSQCGRSLANGEINKT
jgi:hypothetical protein